MAFPVEEKKLYPEADALFVSITKLPAPRVRELTRKWERINDKTAESGVRMLDLYCSAGNASASLSVVDPNAVGPAGDETWSGTWRNVRVFRAGDKGGEQSIFQILREGFQAHSGNSADPLDQAEARIFDEGGSPATKNYRVGQEWRYTDPSDHEQILEDLLSLLSVSNPTVEGETVTGLFACSKIQAQPNEDGSVRFRRVLTFMITVDSLGDLTGSLPLITQEEDVINLFGFEEGTGKEIMYVYPNISPASRVFVMETLSAANLETIPGGSWTYRDRKFDVDEQTGVGTFAVLFEQATWDATWSSDRKKITGTSVSGFLRGLALETTGVDRTQVLADFQTMTDEAGGAFSAAVNYNKGDPVSYSGTEYIFITVHAAGAWNAAHVVEAHYLMSGRRIGERGRGQYVAAGDMRSVYDGTAAADAIVVRAGVRFTEEDRQLGVRVWYRRSETAKDTIADGGGTGEAWLDWTHNSITYVSHYHTIEDHGDGAFTIRQYGLDKRVDLATPLVVRIRPNITEHEQRLVVRIWAGLSAAQKDTLTAASPLGDARNSFTHNDEDNQSVTYSFADVFIDDRKEKGFVVRQVGIQVHAGTADNDALITRIRPLIQDQPVVLQRVWPHRTTVAKDTLIQPLTGNARTGYTFETVSYTHSDVVVEDTGHGGYNVRQTLVDLTGNLLIYWNKNFEVVKTMSRTSDDLTKKLIYTRYIAMRSSEDTGWDWVESKEGAPPSLPYIVVGSGSVVKTGRFMYRCRVLLLESIGGWS